MESSNPGCMEGSTDTGVLIMARVAPPIELPLPFSFSEV